MALEKLTLAALEKTKLKALFDNAMGEVLQSLCHESDIQGNRGITVKLTFTPKDGYIITAMECSHSVPGRKVATMAKLENDHTLNIDTVSNDVRQPDIFDGDKVIPIGKHKEAAQ